MPSSTYVVIISIRLNITTTVTLFSNVKGK